MNENEDLAGCRECLGHALVPGPVAVYEHDFTRGRHAPSADRDHPADLIPRREVLGPIEIAKSS
jgi:hypothetical protein